ncbi:MAG: hypothetical protein IT564_04970 [Rhodospirillales bacterium]|nr:hypothetical protein [Rhodospirillales bacterium]
MSTDVDSAFDIAFWLLDTAERSCERLQPQKLQRLLFLSQAYYGVAFEGRKLMPAVFVADERGPLEPNVYIAFSRGRPKLDVELFLPFEVETFLEALWRRFGHYTADRLTRMTKETIAYRQAFQRGRRAEITFEAMRLSFARGAEAPAVEQVIKPKVMRTQSGRPVAVKAWNPLAKPPGAQATKPEDPAADQAPASSVGRRAPPGRERA